MKQGLYRGMPDEVYHKQLSQEEHYYSSSQLKTMLEDPRKFHEQYILGKKPKTAQAQQDAYDVGTLAHTALLEPSKLKDSYVKWKEGNRTGKIWDQFVEDNPGKLIINDTMKKLAENAIKATKKSGIIMQALQDGEPEVSFFLENFHGIRIKVRADWLEPRIIDDYKTTTGNVRDIIKIKNKIKLLNYDLSAALYVDVVNACIDEFNLDMEYIEKFHWWFASKDKGGSVQPYDATPYLPMGRAKYMKGIELIKQHKANEWDFPEEIITLHPYAYEVGDWIKPEKTENTDSQDEPADEDLL